MTHNVSSETAWFAQKEINTTDKNVNNKT